MGFEFCSFNFFRVWSAEARLGELHGALVGHLKLLPSGAEHSQFTRSCTFYCAVEIWASRDKSFEIMVPGGGVEPPRTEVRRILSRRCAACTNCIIPLRPIFLILPCAPKKSEALNSFGNRAWGIVCGFRQSGFYNWVDGLITEVPTGNDLVIFRNQQDAKSAGLELEVKGQLFRGLEADASYSFQETKDTPSSESRTSAGESGTVRQFNSSSRFRISSPYSSRALQTSQFGLWILSRDNR